MQRIRRKYGIKFQDQLFADSFRQMTVTKLHGRRAVKSIMHELQQHPNLPVEPQVDHIIEE
jgi:hypothetical protein